MGWDPHLGEGRTWTLLGSLSGDKRKLVLQVLEKLHTGPNSCYWNLLQLRE